MLAFDGLDVWRLSRSPSSALIPFLGGRIPLRRPEQSWYPYSDLSTAGSSLVGPLFGLRQSRSGPSTLARLSFLLGFARRRPQPGPSQNEVQGEGQSGARPEAPDRAATWRRESEVGFAVGRFNPRRTLIW